MHILIIGAGNSGLAMAAHLASNGHNINIWNRSKQNIQKLLLTKTIFCSGILNGPVTVDLVTDNMKEALHNIELILVTTPANSHTDIAQLLAVNLDKDIPIILNPGRTFGALNFYLSFRKYNHIFIPKIAEAQTIVYTCRKTAEDSVIIYSLKRNVKIASLFFKDRKVIMHCFPENLKKYFSPVNSFIETSLGNVGMILHCAPFILNAGWTECPTTEYKYYYEGITPTVGKLIEKLDNCRVSVAKELGYRVPSTLEWMKEEYMVEGHTLYECIKNNSSYKEIDAPQSLHHRYIFEDVPYGLVPLEKIGIELKVDMKPVTLIIEMANLLMETDFRRPMNYIDLKIVNNIIAIGHQ